MDDNSPDGTASEIESLKDIRVRLIKIKGKMGLGTSVLEGFQAAKGDYLVMVNADLSHDAKRLPEMIKTTDRADIVIGSRFFKGGSIVGWPISRHVMSRVAILLS